MGGILLTLKSRIKRRRAVVDILNGDAAALRGPVVNDLIICSKQMVPSPRGLTALVRTFQEKKGWRKEIL